MRTLWLFLYLGGLVHALALWGFNIKRPACVVLLLPFLLLPLLGPLRDRAPHLFSRTMLRIAGAIALIGAILFLRLTVQLGWGTEGMPPALAITALGVGGLWVAAGSGAKEDGAAWLMAGLFTLTGLVDGLLPILGAGVAAFAVALKDFPTFPGAAAAPAEGTGHRSWPFSTAFLLALASAKPWWDFGLGSGWVLPSVSLCFGLAIGHTALAARTGRRVPLWVLHVGLGLLAVLYWPSAGIPWGLALGLLAGLAWARLPRPLPLQRLAWGLLLGWIVSFALHTNAWLPGLRHLIWLGNG